MKPILKLAPALKLFGDSDEMFMGDEFQLISLELVTF